MVITYRFLQGGFKADDSFNLRTADHLYEDWNHYSRIHLITQRFYQDEIATDLVLRCNDGEEIQCHQIILCAISNYFKETISVTDVMSHKSCIDVAFPARVIREIMSFIYYGYCDISADTVDMLLSTSMLWQLPLLRNSCIDFIHTRINVKNAIHYYTSAPQHQSADITKHAMHVIKRSFVELCKKGKLNQMDFNNFHKILDSNDMNANTEDIVFQSVIGWVESHPNCVEATKLFETVKFEQLTAEYLCDVVQHHPMMQKPPFINRVRAALTYQLKKQRTPLPTARVTWPKLCARSDTHVLVYGADDKTWNEKGELPSWFNGFTSWCKTDDGMFLLGAEGEDTNECSALIIHMEDGNITNLPKLPGTIRNAGLICAQGHVYVFGGKRFEPEEEKWVLSSEVNRISLTDKIWTTLTDLKYPVCKPLVIERNDAIMVIGGYDKYFKNIKRVQVLNMESGEWVLQENLPAACDNMSGSIVIHNNILTVITSMQLLAYNDDNDSWSVVTYSGLGNRLSAVVYGEHIVVCAEKDNHCQLFYYDSSYSTRWIQEDIDISKCTSPCHYLFAL